MAFGYDKAPAHPQINLADEIQPTKGWPKSRCIKQMSNNRSAQKQ